jgi:hypothetical protein
MKTPALSRLVAAALAAPVVSAEWGVFEQTFESDKPWVEVAAELPAPPLPANLREFAVSGIAPHKYQLDTASISVGADRVIRYTLVIDAAGGARNVSFEGMRCETAEHRRYATGQPDGSWARARTSSWQPIKLASGLSYRKALYEDIFCPDGIRIRDVREVAANLARQGR